MSKCARSQKISSQISGQNNMIGLVSVRSNAVESNPKYQAAVKAQQEKERKAKEPINVEPSVVETKIVRAAKKIERPIIYQNEIKQIITDVAKEHGLTHEDIIGKSRKANIVAARYEAIEAVYRARPKLSLNGIARNFGNKDHTTILHALKKRGIKYV